MPERPTPPSTRETSPLPASGEPGKPKEGLPRRPRGRLVLESTAPLEGPMGFEGNIDIVPSAAQRERVARETTIAAVPGSQDLMITLLASGVPARVVASPDGPVLKVPVLTEPLRGAIPVHVKGDLHLMEGAIVAWDVEVTGDLTLDAGSSLCGSARVQGTVRLGQSAVIAGPLDASRDVHVGDYARVLRVRATGAVYLAEEAAVLDTFDAGKVGETARADTGNGGGRVVEFHQVNSG